MVSAIRCLKVVVLTVAVAFGVSSEARSVHKLEIKGTGLTSESDETTKELCKAFKPTVRQVRNFFSKAYHVESYIGTTERYSPCIAFGTLTYSDGSFGDWTLHSSGTASLIFNRGDSVSLFYKYNKWNDPTACTYGLGSVPDC
jgi:hypothetical protein